MDTKKVFPFKPKFVSKLKQDGKDEGYDINKYGMFSLDIIEGFLAHLSQDILIQTPVSFFEFIPEKYRDIIDLSPDERFILRETDEFFDEFLDGRLILKTNNESFFERKRCCYQFKNCLSNEEDTHGVRCCDKIDSRVAFFAHTQLEGRDKNDYESFLKPKIDQYNELLKQRNMPEVIMNPEGEAPFLYYHCPYSKLYEIVFPVFYDNQVVGCVLVGGILIGDIKPEEILEDLAGKLLEERVLDAKKKKALKESIQKDILARERKLTLIEERKAGNGSAIAEGVRTGNKIDDAYRGAIDLVWQHIKKFEDRFDKRVELHFYKYITQEFTKIKTDFHVESQTEFIKLSANKNLFSVKGLSAIIEKNLKAIADKFFEPSDFIRIFGLTDFNQSELKLLAASDRENAKALKNLIFDLNNIPKEIIENGQNISNKEGGIGTDLIDGFKYTDGHRPIPVEPDDIIRYYPTLSSKVTFIIWKRYNSEANQNPQFINLKNALLDFYTSIAATYASLWGSQTDKRLEDTIRIARHESFQVISRIKDTLTSTFLNKEKFDEMIMNKTLGKKVGDIQIYLELMRFTMDKGAFLFRKKDLKRTHLDLGEILNKALNLYKKQIELKGLWLEYPEKKSLKDVDLIADAILFEHVINNLVDNAVKYCYRGTQIVIKVTQNTKNCTITVVSYGPKISKQDQIFELYTRDDVIGVEGDGIGMYLAKEILKAHDGSIKVESVCQSKLNVPCIENYLVNRPFFKNLGEEKIHEIEDSIYNKYSKDDAIGVVSPKAPNGGFRYIPLPRTFKHEYQSPIYRNTFIIKLTKLICDEDLDED